MSNKRKIDDTSVNCDYDITYINKVKSLLFQQLSEPIRPLHGMSSTEETKMKAMLDSCFQEKVSGSVLVIGSAASGKRQFADRVLSSYKTPNGESIKVAHLQGLQYTKDNHALISLAKQLGIFAETDNFNMSVDALQSYFQQSRLQCVPTVILIEDIDEFTKGNRQVLLYTLLDLMHRQDLYYVVVGLTQRVDITSLLEKRVISRLSAQCVFLRPKSAAEIKQLMLDKLTVTVPSADLSRSSDTAAAGSERTSPALKRIGKLSSPPSAGITRSRSSSGTYLSPQSEDLISHTTPNTFESYVKAFNASVSEIFGPRPLKSITRNPAAVSVSDMVSREVAWGKDVNFFVTVAKLAVTRLSEQHNVLTQPLLSDCFAQMALPDMESVILSLPMVELYLLIGAIRLHIRYCGGNVSNVDPVLQKDGSRVLNVKGVTGFNVEQLIEETEKLTGIIRKKIVMRRQLLDAITSLAQNSNLIRISNGKQFNFAQSGCGVSQILETSQVLLNSSLIEFQITFRSKTLHISDKLRKAVLDPLAPLTYGGVMVPQPDDGASSSSLLADALMQLV